MSIQNKQYNKCYFQDTVEKMPHYIGERVKEYLNSSPAMQRLRKFEQKYDEFFNVEFEEEDSEKTREEVKQ